MLSLNDRNIALQKLFALLRKIISNLPNAKEHCRSRIFGVFRQL